MSRFRKAPECGTRSGYDYHVRDLKEEPCTDCREASSRYWKEQRISRNARINELRRAKRKEKPSLRPKKRFPREEVIDAYGSLCHICGKDIDLDAPSLVGSPGWELSYHPDHVIPLSKGGADEFYNIRPSHAYCNQRKWATVKEEVPEVSMVFVCTGCYRTHGADGESNYCSECKSYKYFDWIDENEEV